MFFASGMQSKQQFVSMQVRLLVKKVRLLVKSVRSAIAAFCAEFAMCVIICRAVAMGLRNQLTSECWVDWLVEDVIKYSNMKCDISWHLTSGAWDACN